MNMRTNYYIKDSEHRAFVACKLTHVYTRLIGSFSLDTCSWYRYASCNTYQAFGVLATDPDTEVCLSAVPLYLEPNGEAKHIMGSYALTYPDDEKERDAINAYKTQYWKWNEAAAKAECCHGTQFKYDHITGDVILDEDLEAQGYIYPSKEAAEADHLYAVIEFDAPKAKKTYTVTKTKTETYIVEADSMKAAQEAMAAGRSKKKSVKSSTRYEKSK